MAKVKGQKAGHGGEQAPWSPELACPDPTPELACRVPAPVAEHVTLGVISFCASVSPTGEGAPLAHTSLTRFPPSDPWQCWGVL